MKISNILGLNARSQLYLTPLNSPQARKIADSKLLMFKILKKAGIPTPEVYKKFKEPKDVFDFEWASLPDAFALKPSHGFGGEGIIVIKKRAKDKNGHKMKTTWINTQREEVTENDLKLHVFDVLEGAFSLRNVPDIAFIQEYVGRHKTFRKYAYRGTPDIRVIVYNKIPVMAELRLPTKESKGKANLHQGAIIVGIDMATGITTKAFWHGDFIKYKPETNRKLHGIKIPHWTAVLEIATRTAMVSGLGFSGVDVILHPERGPMILELNARPGLGIQLANISGLKKRMERVEDLNVRDAEHGVKIAKALFAERFADRVAVEEGIKTVGVWEKITIISHNKKTEIKAKLDTGAWRTSIDIGLAKELGLTEKENILWTKTYKSSLGEEKRKVVNLTFYLAGRRITTIANVASRGNLRTQVIIGRRDLGGFLVKPEGLKK
ncbi:MAG TPA: sugar-transfer associated ATP-grasp domain-containing protein [Candidatus Saccharimonadales bacterium]|nr:sugar-transfer associated ATP-grasp domain-containing protein [Candidatus Saccharimonadales bacterium]